MSDDLQWQVIDERPGSAGFLKVATRQYRMPDGAVAQWDILQGGRTVAVVAVTDDDHVVLVRQFRPGPGRVLLELPGGNVDTGEDVVDAAMRELREETGYAAEKATVVGRTWLASYATHERYAVLATGCRLAGAAELDAEEFCQPVVVVRDRFIDHVRSGDLTDTDIAYMGLDALGALASATSTTV